MQERQTEPWSERLFEYALSALGLIIVGSPLALWMAWSETVLYITLGGALGAMCSVAVLVAVFPEKRRRWLPFDTAAEAPVPHQPPPRKALTPAQERRQLFQIIAILLAGGIGLFVALWAVF